MATAAYRPEPIVHQNGALARRVSIHSSNAPNRWCVRTAPWRGVSEWARYEASNRSVAQERTLVRD
ncbi:MAG: hypothetical protein IAB08_03110 [Bacteroidetes bacterium]|uniref:Uncharacterized protein n=1 Tax=Candidatus Pullibacteroides excrementavium TaxID=2840905 RepID=A0A9D9DTQ5_9BACT|nr:hypothetical protein [Candidatus Pullibacteroides excrementavium]